MKLSKHILISLILVCIAVQGTTLSQICVGKTHCDSKINWAGICHIQADDAHQDHDCAFDHEDSRCIDISITALAGSSTRSASDQFASLPKTGLLQFISSIHLFSTNDFSCLKKAFFPLFTDMTTRSIESTILII